VSQDHCWMHRGLPLLLLYAQYGLLLPMPLPDRNAP
jgi:hypothetical protein